MKILKIKWRDACGDFIEKTKEELEQYEMPIIESVGFLIAEDSKTIKLASFATENFVRNWIVIPKAIVIERKVLKEDG